MKRGNFRSGFCCLMLLALGAAQICRASTAVWLRCRERQGRFPGGLAGAAVRLTNTETQQTREAVTNDTGAYDFATVPPGTYDMNVRKEGFTPSTQKGIAVAQQYRPRRCTLSVGSVSESVRWPAPPRSCRPTAPRVASNVGSMQLANLPMSKGMRPELPDAVRDPSRFRRHPVQATTPLPPTLPRPLVFNVNGASFNINNTKIDGAQSINVWLPHESAYVPTLEAIETVNVVSGSFDAETGLAGGAAIYVSTKSGTNAIHGAVFENHNNQHLNARPFFLPYSQRKPKFVYNDFGAAAGGPIKKDKLFYFGSFEQTNNREAAFLHRHRPDRRHQERQYAGAEQSDLRPDDREMPTARPHALPRPDRSRRPHRCHRRETGEPNAAAEPRQQPAREQLFRERAVTSSTVPAPTPS